MTQLSFTDDFVANTILPFRAGSIDRSQVLKRIADFMISPDYVNARQEFTAQVMRASSTASLYEGLRVSLIQQREDGWSSMLVKPGGGSTIAMLSGGAGTASTPAADSFIYVLSAPSPLKVVSLSLDGYPQTNDLPGPMAITGREEITVDEGDFFEVKAGPHALYLDGPLSECEFLRFIAPESYQYIVSIDRESTALRSVAYANPAMTAEQMFIDLCNAMLVSGAMHQPNKEIYQTFLSDYAIVEENNAFARWKALQGLSRMSSEAAHAVLAKMADGNLPNLAGRARAIQARQSV